MYCYVRKEHTEHIDIDPKMHDAHALASVSKTGPSSIVWDSHPLKHSISNEKHSEMNSVARNNNTQKWEGKKTARTSLAAAEE